MIDAIDPTKPPDGAPALRADLQASLAVATSEVEALRTAQVPAGRALRGCSARPTPQAIA